MNGPKKETAMKYVMKKLFAAALIVGLAVGSYALLGGNNAEAMPPGGPHCKKCKDRPWCGCTLDGAPRISCDPCCYDTYPFMTCLD